VRDTAVATIPDELRGILNWDDLDHLWDRVTDPDGGPWFLYQAGREPADAPATPREVAAFVAEVDTVLRREHREDYCGIVYTDDPARPTYVKVYHPRGLGSSCALPGHAVPPAWVLSRHGPVAVAPPPRPRRGLLDRLLGARGKPG